MEDDKPWDAVGIGSVCYAEELCGQRVFKVKYEDDYPEDQKASWASTGTTQVLEWFDECATAMYGCTEVTDFDKSTYEGTIHRWNNNKWKEFPIVFSYDVFEISPFPNLVYKGSSWSPAEAFPLGNCEGDCNQDSDCQVRSK
jgi:hypothetical protein